MSEGSGGGGVARSVVIAGLFTLLISLVRLVGELQNWPIKFFNPAAGGVGSIVGIIWLVPVFGFWFGRKLAQGGHAPGRPALAALASLLGAVALFGGIGFVFEKYDLPTVQKVLRYVAIGGPALILLPLLLWFRAGLTLVFYAMWARVPVIAIQYVAIHQKWGTHYESVHPKFGNPPAAERAQMLMMAQATFWVPLTVLLGVFFAVLGAWTVRGGGGGGKKSKH